MAGKGVEDLYKNYGILADAGEKISEHKDAFEAILSAAKGSTGEKRLVAAFITKFSRHFPDLADTVMDALLDLVEDEEAVIRHGAIKCLPDLCKGTDGPSQCTKVADVLTQLLVSEDPTDIALVKTAMATILQIDTQKALVGIFDQIMGEDDSVREKAIAYVSVPVMDMRHKLFIPKEDNEKFLVGCIKKVISDVTGEEFETFIEILGKLHHLSSSVGGIQQIVDIITEQAELQTDFQPDALESVDRFITCFRLALKFFKKGGSFYPFLRYLCLQMLPVLSQIPSEQEQHSVLQLMAEGSLYLQDEEIIDCLPFLYAFLLEHMPTAPEDSSPSSSGSGSPKLQFSVVECVLFTFHQLIRKCPEFFTSEENSERLKEFRLRLQFFARGCQTYHGQLQVALKGKTALELKEEQNKLRQVAMKTTANISSLIKDFFHNPPSYKTVVQLSWGVKKVTLPLQAGAKRSTETPTSGAGPAKRKLSPIRFSASKTDLGPKKQTQEIYHPPRDQFSKKAATNGKFPDFEYPYGGDGGGGSGRGRGRGRGRGARGWNRRGNRNWRQK